MLLVSHCVFCFFSFLLQATAIIIIRPEGHFYRDQNKMTLSTYGNFKQHLNSYLAVTKLKSSLVGSPSACILQCVNEPKCYSCNVAASPDSKALYLCELLTTDKYRAKTKFFGNATFHHYSIGTPCQSGPCQNNGDCIPNYELNSYHCDCPLGFLGIRCERNGKSCSEIKYRSPQATNGSYVIDPDGEEGYEPFTVFCDMTDKNGVGVTVIGHDSEARTYVNGYEPRGSYVRHVHYLGAGITSISQIAGITYVSTSCEQFIKFECYGALLLETVGNPHGWWMSRNNSKMTYWGGATPADSYKCACGVTTPNTCADTSRGCNCDKNDNAWQQDSGLLTEKSDLPASALHFGDTGSSSEEGYHTLGKFKCYGMS